MSESYGGGWMTEGKEVCQTERAATATHGGQAVNIIISDKFGKWLLAIVVVGIVLLSGLALMASKAEIRAEQAQKSADYSANEFRMTQFWLQRVAARDCPRDNLPAIPASLLK
jgi:hypothetical protein